MRVAQNKDSQIRQEMPSDHDMRDILNALRRQKESIETMKS